MNENFIADQISKFVMLRDCSMIENFLYELAKVSSFNALEFRLIVNSLRTALLQADDEFMDKVNDFINDLL